MDINQLNYEIVKYTEEKELDTLTLYQLEAFLNQKNIHHYALKNWYSKTEFDCYLIVLLDEKWYYASGSPYFSDTEINFDFYIDPYFFTGLTQKDVQTIQNNLNTFKEEIENAISIISDPDATRRVTLERIFSPSKNK